MNRPHISRTLFSAFLAVVATVCLALTASADVVTVGSDGYATLTGFVYCDLNDNLMYDDNEGLIPNVWIILSKQVGENEIEVARTFTKLYGDYKFDEKFKITPGTYSLTQVQPIEFRNGLPNAPGTVNGVPVGEAVTSGDFAANKYIDIVLGQGDVATDYNFSEAALKSAYLSKRILLARKPPVELIPEPGVAAMMSFGLLACLGLSRCRREHVNR